MPYEYDRKNIFHPLKVFFYGFRYTLLVLFLIFVRHQCLNGIMEKQYPGPFCKQINLSSEQLHSIDTLEPLKQDCVKNGVVFEIQKI